MSQSNSYLFKAVSGYFSNFYVNVLYNAAHSASLNSTEKLSITDAYRSKVSCYIQAIKTVESAYKRLVSDLHSYCVKISTRFNSMTFSQFINSFVSSFVPVDYIDSMSASNKDEIFSVVITDLAATLGSICTKPDYLRKIIDNHDKNRTVTCEMLFKESLRSLDNQRDMMLSKFVREISQAKDYISSDAANQLRKVLDEKENIIHNRNEEIAELRHQISILKENDAKMRRLVELLQKNKIVIHKDVPVAVVTPSVVVGSAAPPRRALESPKPSPKSKPQPLTERNLTRHTIDNIKVQPKPIDEKVESNIMGSIQKVSHRGGGGGNHHRDDDDDDDDDDDLASESESESESDSSPKTLTSGKKSVIDNIDGLILTQ